MAIRNDVTRRAMKTFVMIVLIAGVAKSEVQTCSYNFNATHAIITSKTSKWYPEAKCTWSYNGEPLNGLPPTHRYYSTACSTSLKIEYPGWHQVFLDFLPDQDTNNAAMTQKIVIEVVTPTLTIAMPDSNELIESSVMVKEHTKLDLICTAMGGKPEVRDLSFECQNERKNPNRMTVYSQTAKTPILKIAMPDSNELIESSVMVKEHTKLDLICTAMGGKPEVRDLSFECQNERKNPNRMTVYSQTASIFITATANMDGKQCTCTAKQLSIPGDITKSVTINVAKTPTLSIAREDNHEAIATTLVVKENEKLGLMCTSMGGNPLVEDLTFECPREKRNPIEGLSENADTVRIEVILTANMDGLRCICAAKHLSVNGEITKNVTIYIAKKPGLPTVNSNKGIIINSMLIVQNGERVTLTCSALGGTPKESNITLFCFDGYNTYSNFIYGDTISLNIYTNSRMDERQCNCLADHISLRNSFFNRTLTVKVIARPAIPSCKYKFDKNNVHITCTTSKVYPQGKCDWRCSRGCESSTKIISESPHISVEYSSAYVSRNFSTTCTASLQIKHEATFKIQVSMYPDLSFINSEEYKSFASVSKEINFAVEPAKIDRFYIDYYSYDNQLVEVEAGVSTHSTCTAKGNPLPTVMLSHTNTRGTHDLIKQTDAYELEHTFYPSCNMTGLLMWNVYNILNRHNESRNIYLKVKCKAEYEIASGTEPYFDAPVNADFNITLFIRVYPKPSIYKLFKGHSQMEENNEIGFQYTNENLSLGEIKVKMKLLNEKGFGMYSLKVWNKWESILKFTLKPKGPPLCPTDFTIQNISTNTLTITWRPGFDGGLRQTFSVLSYNPANNVSESFQVQETSNDIMIYNVTGLSEGTTYLLSIDTENSAGKTQCSHVIINGTTSDHPKIQTFTINKCNPKDVKYVNANSETTLTCTTFGDPLPSIVISYINSKRKSKTLSLGNAYELSHKFYPTCSDTGLYRCSVSNMLNAQEETRELNLKVTCPAEYYLTADTLPLYGVSVNEDLNITLPVRVYPEPKDFSLFQGFSTIKQPKNIMFKYTNENFSLGEISIAMRIQNETGLGMYSLRVWKPQESTLYFNLTAEGPPLCPTDFIIENVSTNVMTISFRPGFDGGLRQTFSVFSHDLANNITDSFQVEQTSNDVMVYNVTGLSEGKMYILSVETKNSKGKTKCPHVNINWTTSAGSKQSSSESYSLILYIGLTAALVIISGVTCGLLYNKRVALKRWCTFQSSHRDLYDTPETREAHSEDYYLQPVRSVEQVQVISPNEYDVVFDGYEDASS